MTGCTYWSIIAEIRIESYFINLLTDFGEFYHGLLEKSQNIPGVKVGDLLAEVFNVFALEGHGYENDLVCVPKVDFSELSFVVKFSKSW